MAGEDLLPLVAPLAALQAILAIVALYDLWKHESARYLSRVAWAVVVLVFGIFGPLLYFVLGRGES